MAEGIQGLAELRAALSQLPDRLQKSVARSWAERWSGAAWVAAVREAPRGKTGNLIKGLVRRDATPQHLKRIASLARSVVIGKRPAFHLHWVVLGTKARWTGSSSRRRSKTIPSVSRNPRGDLVLRGAVPKRAYRGIMPANDFMLRAARPLQQPAIDDLRVRVQRSLDRLAKRGG